MIRPFMKLRVAPQSDRATVFPLNIDQAKMRINYLKIIEKIEVHHLVTIDRDGKAHAFRYKIEQDLVVF